MDGVVSTENVLSGEPRIEGRRIAVRHIAEEIEIADRDAASVAAEFNLDIAQVYRALVYYHENAGEMERIRRTRTDHEGAIIGEAITAPGDQGLPTDRIP